MTTPADVDQIIDQIAEERWRRIPGYSGHYEVSDLGSVRSVKRHARTENQFGEASRTVPAHIMRLHRHADGRARVQLCRDGLRSNHDVHTLVLEAFVGPRPRGHYAEYLDGDSSNCSLVNLAWMKRDWGGRGRKLKRKAVAA
jgi:hypothetical protein